MGWGGRFDVGPSGLIFPRLHKHRNILLAVLCTAVGRFKFIRLNFTIFRILIDYFVSINVNLFCFKGLSAPLTRSKSSDFLPPPTGEQRLLSFRVSVCFTRAAVCNNHFMLFQSPFPTTTGRESFRDLPLSTPQLPNSITTIILTFLRSMAL